MKQLVKNVYGATTAIVRVKPPVPLRWMQVRSLLKGRCLDYGCGRGPWLGMEGYDPHWQPRMPPGLFDTVVSVYVLNVVPEHVEQEVLAGMLGKLSQGGTAYAAVRRDIPRQGRKGRKCFQRWVELDERGWERVPGPRRFALYRMSP